MTKIKYPTFVYDTFKDIYFTDEENQWIDILQQILILSKTFTKSPLPFALYFRPCIIKRPYNLFHR